MSKFVIALNENNEKLLIITHANQDFGADDFKGKLGLKTILSRGHIDVDKDGHVFIDPMSAEYNEKDALFIEEKFISGEMKMINLIRRYGISDILLTNIISHRYLVYIKDCHEVNMVSDELQNKTFGYIHY